MLCKSYLNKRELWSSIKVFPLVKPQNMITMFMDHLRNKVSQRKQKNMKGALRLSKNGHPPPFYETNSNPHFFIYLALDALLPWTKTNPPLFLFLLFLALLMTKNRDYLSQPLLPLKFAHPSSFAFDVLYSQWWGENASGNWLQ